MNFKMKMLHAQMKQFFPLILTFGFFAGTTFGQAQKDPKADKVLNDLAANFQKTPVWKIDFTQQFVHPETKVNESMNGTLFVKGNTYRIKTSKFERISDGSSVWDVNKEIKEVYINSASGLEEELQPSSLFTFYKKGYSTLYLKKDQAKGKIFHVVDLTPTDKNKPYFKVRLAVDEKTSDPIEFKIFYKDGSQITYTLNQVVKNPELSGTFFQFNKSEFPGMHVEDLR